MTQRNLSTEKKVIDLENRLLVAKGEGEGVECLGTSGKYMQNIAFGMN